MGLQGAVRTLFFVGYRTFLRGSRRAGLVRRAKGNESMRVGYETFMLCLPTIVVSITRIHLPRREWKRERERETY